MEPIALYALLPDMAVFARVVDAGNFSEAARQLGSTPSTVSRQIKRLEDALGIRLLDRSTRAVRITESGNQVYRHCREMLVAASAAVDAASQSVGRPQGKVRLSAPISFAKSVVHPLIPAFLQRYAEVDVQLVFTDDELDPLADNVDLVIRLTEHPPPGLAGRRLGSVRWLLCASEAYLSARGAPAGPLDLAAHDCIYLGETADDHHWRFRRRSERSEHLAVDVRGRYIANDVEARLEAASAGFGIAIVPEFAAAEALRQGALVQVLPNWELETLAYGGTVWLLYAPNRFLPPKVRVLIDYLAEQMG